MMGSVKKRGSRWEARWRGEVDPTTGRRRNMSQSFRTALAAAGAESTTGTTTHGHGSALLETMGLFA